MYDPFRRFYAAFHNAINQSLVPPEEPSDSDKKTIQELEALRASNPFLDSFRCVERSPDICGSRPQRIVAEVRIKASITAITYWYYWEHDLGSSDHEDWEPVSLTFHDDTFRRAYARIHDGLVHFDPVMFGGKPMISFSRFGHTPVLRVKDRNQDVFLYRKRDGSDHLRELWLNYCFLEAEAGGWTTVSQPMIEAENPPIFDPNWETWGKHSVYLRI